ncbi:natural cytotoxicity triggering receptor 3-like isoform X2 [Pyxicephalus adspersus]|uniref:natural cytotoxicity triggering receptor 3-like isoform X2 n=1 Tax=Pyxicephalus adspersus TaxID=30357 RepID=UPI003B59D204
MRSLQLLLLLVGPLQGFASQAIHVWQIPVISAVGGSSVTLPCVYNISSEQEATIGSYKWYKHLLHTGMEISNSKELIGRISRTATDQFIERRSASIILHRVGSSDSGIYYCEVIFQIGGDVTAHGNGTFLNVTDISQKGHNICIVLKVVGFVVTLLTALISYLCARMGH